MKTLRLAPRVGAGWLLGLLLLSYGCEQATESGDPTSQAVKTKTAAMQETAVVSAKSLSDFSVYSLESTNLRDRVNTTNGRIGSAKYVEIGSVAQIHGDIESAGTVTLQDRCDIYGDVTAKGAITKQNQIDIIGAEHPYTNGH